MDRRARFNALQDRRREFHNKKFLGLDYGTKTLGISLYHVGRDPFALPYESLKRRNNRQIISNITQIVENENIDYIVLGRPQYLNGEDSAMTVQVINFGRLLSKKLQKKIFYQDESLSSKEAENLMKNSPKYNFRVDPKKIDSLSASIILEDFFYS